MFMWKKDEIKFLSDIVVATVGIVALLLSFIAEDRNSKRFDAQIKNANLTLAATIRPLLNIYSDMDDVNNIRSVNLTNNGVGPAIIKNIQFWYTDHEFCYKDQEKRSLVDCIPLKFNATWDDYFESDAIPYVKPGEEIHLVMLSKKELLHKKQTLSHINILFNGFESSLNHVTVCIEYTDTFERSKYNLYW